MVLRGLLAACASGGNMDHHMRQPTARKKERKLVFRACLAEDRKRSKHRALTDAEFEIWRRGEAVARMAEGHGEYGEVITALTRCVTRLAVTVAELELQNNVAKSGGG